MLILTWVHILFILMPLATARAYYQDNFDPNDITVTDPSVKLLAELPSGDVDLKTYRAPLAVIDAYSIEHQVAGGDIKDFPKAPDCTRAEIDALRRWGMNDIYREVNSTLRRAQKGKVNGVPISSKLENQILVIASGVNCAPQYSGPAVRGEQMPSEILKQYQPGVYIGVRGFTSTTKGSVPSPFFVTMPHHSFIANAQGADVDALGIAVWPDEKEVLIRPGTVFKVVARKDDGVNIRLTLEQN